MEKNFELDEKNLMLIFSYLGIFALIPRLTKKEDEYISWHSKNGLGLFIFEIALFLITFPVFFVFSFIFGSPFIILLSFFYFIFIFGLIVFHIFLIYKAIKGEKFEIPYITTYAQKL